MTTLTTNALAQDLAQKTPLTFKSVIAALFAVNLREKLDAATGGDKSDAAFAWGL
jgi:hypothetical protein